jgi:hypothetical protein
MATSGDGTGPVPRKHLFTVSMYAWFTATSIFLGGVAVAWTGLMAYLSAGGGGPIEGSTLGLGWAGAIFFFGLTLFQLLRRRRARGR